MKSSILIVDDEKNTREGLKWSLEDAGYRCMTAEDGERALRLLDEEDFDLVITDLKMPGIDGMELLRRIKRDDPAVEVIMLTAHGTIETAVAAMEQGAAHYQTKPVDLKELRVKVDQALGRRDLAIENRDLRAMVDKRAGLENVIGVSPAMERVFQAVRQVAPSRATALIQGESGTGKELIAHAIHLNSPRAKEPFIAVNCGALPTSLLESELFGHEKGAFTHAFKTKPGRFEMADGGTIFLDEIGETAPEFQVKLLRVLQEQSFERVGGVDLIKVDVRVIAATNHDLKRLMEEGKFREDLFYRLNVVTIDLPPLRERIEDMPLLIDAFAREFCAQNGRASLRVSPKAMTMLQQYPWPGNVRQLRNVIERLVVMTDPAKDIEPADLPEEISLAAPPRGTVALRVGATLADAEREMIRATLAAQEGNRAQSAKILGIGRKTLYRKMEEYDIHD
jgi:DNA-binding NtrC family response regulator